jgi:hypothetical protein
MNEALIPRRRHDVDLGEVAAVEVRLEALGGARLFEDPALRGHVFERALFDKGMKACCVLPEGMRLVYAGTVELRPVLRSLKVQTEEYAEIYGAPERRVWRHGFGLHPLSTHRDMVAAAAALLRLPVEQGLAATIGDYPFTISGFHDRHGNRFSR